MPCTGLAGVTSECRDRVPETTVLSQSVSVQVHTVSVQTYLENYKSPVLSKGVSECLPATDGSPCQVYPT